MKDPLSNEPLSINEDRLVGDNIYLFLTILQFHESNINSDEWMKLNKQFLNYHKSLSVYTAINSTPIINYLSLETEFGLMKNKKVLDIGGDWSYSL